MRGEFMDIGSFAIFLQERNLPAEQIDSFSAFADRFEQSFLSSSCSERASFFIDFSEIMMMDGSNTEDNYYALVLYGRFLRDNELFRVALELIDGAEALDNLYKKTAEYLGESRRDELFSGLDLIPLGTPNEQKPAAMLPFLNRLLKAEPGIGLRILSSGLRDLNDAFYIQDRKKYVELGDIDGFILYKKQTMLEQLEKIMQEDRLFFNQKITQEVIDFVRDDPEIMQGVRVGNIVYETKIPFSTIEYLGEMDETRKRFHYCHCPWVKASLRDGRSEMPSDFCNCSAAFHKKPWEVLFGQKLKAEVLESVLHGDMRCRFAIHLPEDYSPAAVPQESEA